MIGASFPRLTSFSQSSKADRVALLERVVEEYKKRIPDIAKSISEEMGAPMSVALTVLAVSIVAASGLAIGSIRFRGFHIAVLRGLKSPLPEIRQPPYTSVESSYTHVSSCRDTIQ